jgi:hypothetical protein
MTCRETMVVFSCEVVLAQSALGVAVVSSPVYVGNLSNLLDRQSCSKFILLYCWYAGG